MAGAGASPMGYLRTFGPHADPVTSLTWGLLTLSLAVVAIVAALVVVGVAVRRSRGGELPAVRPGAGGLGWIYVGLTLTGIALVGSLVWTLEVLAAVNSPGSKPALTVQVTGHQWWWEVRYPGERPADAFTTANEIHIPVGRPVLVELRGADVIHSFWIPTLAGKTDTIPGRVNLTWLQADRAGVFRGQCTEYCGAQHAHMAAFVVADPPAAFETWRQRQLAPASAPADAVATDGAAVFQAHCSACHAVRGTLSDGVVGPDLTHVMSRQTLAAGALPNTGAGLAGWISDPQALKPGAKMPATNLSGPELNAVVAYVETLK
ncbi:MAG TPA: cytochrome c oxidase subunit II [Caulobacteraceae bacterium]|nr:cytochrome c oxidase subunit II [Caulobacteraceae bacterium]